MDVTAALADQTPGTGPATSRAEGPRASPERTREASRTGVCSTPRREQRFAPHGRHRAQTNKLTLKTRSFPLEKKKNLPKIVSLKKKKNETKRVCLNVGGASLCSRRWHLAGAGAVHELDKAGSVGYLDSPQPRSCSHQPGPPCVCPPTPETPKLQLAHVSLGRRPTA